MATQNDETIKDTDKVMSFSDMVEFEVKYPKDYGMTDGKPNGKKKHFKDGDTIELHRLQADDWAARGLGKIGKAVKTK